MNAQVAAGLGADGCITEPSDYGQKGTEGRKLLGGFCVPGTVWALCGDDNPEKEV